MLERKQSGTTAGFGQGYLNCGSSGVKTGTVVYMSGVFSDTGGPSGKAGKPGYAPSGAIQFTPVGATSISGDSNTTYYLMDKLQFKRDDSDLTLDTIVSGQGIITYSEGYFETDQYTLIGDTATVGALLYVSTGGVGAGTTTQPLLTTGSLTGWVPRGIFLGKKTSFDSNYTATGQIYFYFRGVGFNTVATS